jgi:uncharacterized protein YuzE
MRLKYDLNVGALYIRLSDRAVSRTVELDDNTNIDLDSAGSVIGIEVISINHPWALSRVLQDYRLPAGEDAQVKSYFCVPLTPAAASRMAAPLMPKPPSVEVHATRPVLVGAAA